MLDCVWRWKNVEVEGRVDKKIKRWQVTCSMLSNSHCPSDHSCSSLLQFTCSMRSDCKPPLDLYTDAMSSVSFKLDSSSDIEILRLHHGITLVCARRS